MGYRGWDPPAFEDEDEDPAPLPEPAEQLYVSAGEISRSWFPDLD